MAEGEAAANVNVTSALPDDIRESVAVGNIKSVGEAGSIAQNVATAALVAHQARLNMIAEASVAKGIEMIYATSPSEGGVDVATLQQLMKGAQTTPPTMVE